jgi:DNA-binding LacI/PurR family transcriptional regulator
MPKRVYEAFLRRLRRDIESRYVPGQRYLTVRAIAERFGVSLQTAQKGVKELSGQGLLDAFPKAGIRVSARRASGVLSGRKIAVLSNQHDRRFDQAFLAGIDGPASQRGIEVGLVENAVEDTSALSFGDYLLGLDCDGVIALAFKDAHLGFYHALREGLDIVSDIILDDLPLLPAVQTDNYRHGRQAGETLRAAGHSHALAAGYYPEQGNRRLEGFRDGFCVGEEQQLTYVCLGQPRAVTLLDHFYYYFSARSAVFSLDYAANYLLAAKFVQHNVAVARDNFVVYDSEEERFAYAGLPPVRSAAPSLRSLGQRLGATLVHKWETGAWPEPLQRKV